MFYVKYEMYVLALEGKLCKWPDKTAHPPAQGPGVIPHRGIRCNPSP